MFTVTCNVAVECHTLQLITSMVHMLLSFLYSHTLSLSLSLSLSFSLSPSPFPLPFPLPFPPILLPILPLSSSLSQAGPVPEVTLATDSVDVVQGPPSDEVTDLRQRLTILQMKRADDKARIKELEKYKAQLMQVGLLVHLCVCVCVCVCV